MNWIYAALALVAGALLPLQALINARLGYSTTGGLFGAAFVVVATLAIPRIGASSLVALVVLGQMAASLALDHFGILQAPKPVDMLRILGALLVIGGVLLVLQPWKAPLPREWSG